MSLSKSTAHESLVHQGLIVAKKPKSGYTPEEGDFLVYDATGDDYVDQAAANENPDLYCQSINSSNGTISAIMLQGGVTMIVEYSTQPSNRLEKVEASGDRGSVMPTRDRLRADDANGKTGSKILAIDYPATGLMVVQFD